MQKCVCSARPTIGARNRLRAPAIAPSSPVKFKWNLADIFPGWDAWEEATTARAGIERYAALKGTLSQGPDRLLEAFQLSEELGQLAYRVWYYPSLRYDEDQRDNSVNASVSRCRSCSRAAAGAVLVQPGAAEHPAGDRPRMDGGARAAASLPVRDRGSLPPAGTRARRGGEKLMSLSSRLASAPNEAYWSLSTADAKFPKITLSTGRRDRSRTASIGRSSRPAASRRTGRRRSRRCTGPTATLNTYATLYNGVCQRDWFQARARGYSSTLEAALHGDNIPTSVVENLIETTRAGVEPFRRYHRLRRKTLGVRPTGLRLRDPAGHVRPEVRVRRVLDWIVESVEPLGAEYQPRMREGFSGRWIDVYENEGKRSGAYSAPVYGTHPYMLMNYTDTLDDVFTLAHEMGHSMHTILSHETQPFIYSSYTIFVAEVPSTLSEALLLDYMLERSTDPAERIVLLQHAIDNITSTFYTQVMFADFELRAHRLAEEDKPITSEILTEIYTRCSRTTTAMRST